jgi:hypothetical protein
VYLDHVVARRGPDHKHDGFGRFCNRVLPLRSVVIFVNFSVSFLFMGFFGGLFTGVYATIFIPTAYLMWNHRREGGFSGKSQLLGMAFVILFVLSTIHLVLSLVMLFDNLVDLDNLTASYQYISDGDRPINMASMGIWIVMVVVADAIVVSIHNGIVLSCLVNKNFR